eukprot:CAMPEP_0118698156 /NCGR_PEP_ID=MMETSP0800-20121206/15020_1 /TAXON_ID=210618 ORGANISM="Striatella unipunctata, Strain CCMP2910" /NCGR_SAMPLE_ID=MMETSP0800 /ASSEMBLY_ACC=CAM_ASM_000638 /LENGTH=219 /DNA_ID=CAMNT_0006597897 /DNA_START=36 /DNA_END=695 /DNA_ORIENTATION=-
MTCTSVLMESRQPFSHARPLLENVESDNHRAVCEEREKRSVEFASNDRLAVVVGQVRRRTDSWYTSEDLARFRSDAQARGRWLLNRPCSNFLSIAVASADSTSRPNEKTQNALNAWASHDDCRGLEAWANTDYARRKLEYHEMLHNAILEAQCLCMTIDEIAEVSRSYTRTSSFVAQQLGAADLHAASSNASPKRPGLIKRISSRRGMWSSRRLLEVDS